MTIEIDWEFIERILMPSVVSESLKGTTTLLTAANKLHAKYPQYSKEQINVILLRLIDNKVVGLNKNGCLQQN